MIGNVGADEAGSAGDENSRFRDRTRFIHHVSLIHISWQLSGADRSWKWAVSVLCMDELRGQRVQ
jgi:hypothetical protein